MTGDRPWPRMAGLVALLREAPFINAGRCLAYARLLAVFMGIALAYDTLSTAIGHHPFAQAAGPKPAPTDFLSFWSAGRLALQGHAAQAWDPALLFRQEDAAAAMTPGTILAFFYPPPFLLLCLPFAALPYIPGFLAFVSGSAVLLATALRRLLPRGWGWLAIASFPGLLMNASTGQNGFLTGSCFAWAALWLDTRPVLAGAVLGGLVIKPHMALAVPVALAAARRARALAGFIASAAALCGLSLAAFGPGAWAGFLACAGAARDALEHHPEDWGKLQSLFATLRHWGAGLDLAYAAQAACAGMALLALATAASRTRRTVPGAVLMAATVACAMLCSPHLLDYDLAATGVTLAAIAGQGVARGFMPWEKLGLALAFFWPLVARLATQNGAAPVGPFILVALLAIACRRMLSVPHPAADAPARSADRLAAAIP